MKWWLVFLHDTLGRSSELINLEIIEEIFGARWHFWLTGYQAKNQKREKSEFETLQKVTRKALLMWGSKDKSWPDRKHNMMTLEE